MNRGLILQLQPSCPPDRLGRWLQSQGVPYDVDQVWLEGEPGKGRQLEDARFLAVLGSSHSVNDAEPGWVAQVIAAVRTAIQEGVPVLGICFGAQALAVALGGSVSRMDTPEISWRQTSTSGSIVPPGPWIVWHYEAFTVPPGAERLCWTEFGPLGFRQGPHLGVQFHAETTAAGPEVWIGEEREALDHWRVDTEALRDDGRRLEPEAGAATERLFANWWAECVEGRAADAA